MSTVSSILHLGNPGTTLGPRKSRSLGKSQEKKISACGTHWMFHHFEKFMKYRNEGGKTQLIQKQNTIPLISGQVYFFSKKYIIVFPPPQFMFICSAQKRKKFIIF